MRIVSGGQTGVDRAALDVAVELAIPYAGWCPRGGWAEDLPEPPGLLASYAGLTETPSADPRTRTIWNVRDSDAVLVLTSPDVTSPGTTLTILTAQRLDRPLLVTRPDGVGAIARWLDGLDAAISLDMAGPRESALPGIYASSHASLLAVLTDAATR